MAMFNFISANGDIRPAAVAGSFYPGTKDELVKMVKECYCDAKTAATSSDIAAVIVPHAGYVFSGSVAASAFSQISTAKEYEHIFLIGPSHHVYLDSASVNTQFAYYATPLGNVPVDTALCQKLINDNNCFTYSPKAHSKEHCLEVQLPLLQYRLKKMPQIVPIIVATQDAKTIHKIANALKPYFNDKNLFVISSDFSHYPSYSDALIADKATGDSIMTGSPRKFIEALMNNEDKHIANLATSACGQSAILTLLDITSQENDIKIKHITYCNSGDSEIYGEKDRVVGYHAFAFIREKRQTEKSDTSDMNFSLTDKEKQTLLTIARRAIINHLGRTNDSLYNSQDISDTLRMHCGAFVTLNEDGHLRGCIGMLKTEEPLYKTIEEMAVEAAFGDPRFNSLQASELKLINIEISVLSPLHKISSIDEFILGRHGIYIKKGNRSGTFLPQVADEVNWTKEEFLGHCAQDKAGIGWDGWRDADLYTYEAVVFKEAATDK